MKYLLNKSFSFCFKNNLKVISVYFLLFFGLCIYKQINTVMIEGVKVIDPNSALSVLGVIPDISFNYLIFLITILLYIYIGFKIYLSDFDSGYGNLFLRMNKRKWYLFKIVNMFIIIFLVKFLTYFFSFLFFTNLGMNQPVIHFVTDLLYTFIVILFCLSSFILATKISFFGYAWLIVITISIYLLYKDCLFVTFYISHPFILILLIIISLGIYIITNHYFIRNLFERSQ